MIQKSAFVFLLTLIALFSIPASAAERAPRMIRPVLLHSLSWSQDVFTLRLEIRLCRDFNAQEFEVGVRQENNAQRVTIVDRVGVDCRAPRLQQIELQTTALRDDKPVYLSNPVVVDYEMLIPGPPPPLSE